MHISAKCLTLALAAFAVACAPVREAAERLSTSTLITYMPVKYCNGLYDSAGTEVFRGEDPILVEEVIVFKIRKIENRQPTAVSVRPGYFYVRISDTRMATRAAQILTTIPDRIDLAPGAIVDNPGLIALRVADYQRIYLNGDESSGYTISIRPLNYDPTLTDAAPRPWAAINAGRQVLATDLRVCRREDVFAEAERLP